MQAAQDQRTQVLFCMSLPLKYIFSPCSESRIVDP